MKSTFIALAFLGIGLVGCNHTTKDKSATKKHYKYYCIMHPELGSDKPGICPKCGMHLVEREDDQ